MDKKILFCFKSYEDRRILSDSLNLPNEKLIQNRNVETRGHYTFMVFKRDESKLKQIKTSGNYSSVLIFDTSYDEEMLDNMFIIDCFETLELFLHVNFTPSSKFKIITHVFKKEEEDEEEMQFEGISLLKKHKKRKIKKHVKSVKFVKEDKCVSCLEEDTKIILVCGHQCFCKNCTLLWIDNSAYCPICRSEITLFIEIV